MFYDDPVYLYRTYYILDLFQSNQIVNYLNKTLAANDSRNYPLLVEVSCNNTNIFPVGSDAKAICERLMGTDYMDIEHIYFTYQDVSKLTACIGGSGDNCERNASLRGVSANAVGYLRALDGEGKSGYRIVIEYSRMFDKKLQYFYASLVIPTPTGGS